MDKNLVKFNVTFGTKMKITMDPKIGRPINEEESAKLASLIGIITIDLLPMLTKWSDINVNNDLQDSFEIYMDVNMGELGVKESLIDRLKNSSRQECYQLYRHYKKFAPVDEAKANKLVSIKEEQHWKEFCERFAKPEYERICAKNATNRNKVKVPHISERKPFTVHRNEINMMIREVDEYNQQEILKTSNVIVLEVLVNGSSYIKDLGYGPKPPSKHATMVSITSQHLKYDLAKTQQKLDKLESEVKELQTQVTDI
ncbi:hypothetical protein GH714_036917 [Hevea brasiliensis]|uniref:Uncharacterized protein n=1 Tax=Hevea brasiliensis TaxID=3981 RepID=A0A6A6LM52_HEVBR|nr:hypothetical protein GH714_036917 [Hevea brasiliensis]